MRIHWWQSIRWRLALGSVLVTLLAVTLFALTMLGIVAYYYGIDLKNQMDGVSADKAFNIGQSYMQSGSGFPNVVKQAFAPSAGVQSTLNQQYLIAVFDQSGKRVYPAAGSLQQSKGVALLGIAQSPSEASKVYQAVEAALDSGRPITGELGAGGLFAQPFIVQPIFRGGDGRAIGVLFMTPRVVALKIVSPFVAAVLSAMIISFLVVAVITVVAAVLFSRTITRPLAKLTNAVRVMAAGDYSARVTTNAQGELGELAGAFNEMVAQLNRDVSELRQQETWRRELIMSITHDLATPLTAIAGLGESLVDGVNQSREDYEMSGRIIMREMLRLRRLVKDMHMMAKVEAGAVSPQKKTVRLAGLVDEVLAILVSEFERARVEPRNLIPYHLPMVKADPDMLMRVFTNLCNNALQHTPPEGIITIEAIQRDNELAIAITDTGPGVPVEALSRVFERFFRADTARQSSTGGSGLGLAIVRAIVEAHGGRIWVENVSGAGARFIFTLPLQAIDQFSLAQATTQPILRKNVRKLPPTASSGNKPSS